MNGPQPSTEPDAVNPFPTPWARVAIEAASAAARRLMDLHRLEGRGSHTVNEHDDASIHADIETEAAILQSLEENRVTGTFLSEEYLKDGCRPELRPEGGPGFDGGRRVYVVADPLDGSAIYAQNLPVWWYACVGIHAEDGAPLGACIIDVPRRVAYACDSEKAYRAPINFRSEAGAWRPLSAPPERPLSKAWLEIYVMKPKYLALASARYAPLVNAFSGIVPNGGPGGFTDCADGLADVYFHYDLPGTEHLSGGLMIAERAGCVVTDLAGCRIAFDPSMTARPEILCATGPRLHEIALDLLARNSE